MPTFKVTDPNTGRTVRLTGDTPPSAQELEDVFAQLSPVKDAVKSRAPVDIDAFREEALRKMADETGPIEAIGAGFEAGARTLQRAIGIKSPQDEFSKRELELLKEQRPISTGVGEILGESAPFIGAGIGAGALSSIGLRILAATGIGASESGFIARGKGFDAEGIGKAAAVGGAVAGTLEAVLPSILRVGSSLVRRVLGRPPLSPVIDQAGNISEDLVEALGKSGLSPEDLGQAARQQVQRETAEGATPEQAARKAFLEQEGIAPTKAQVSRDAGLFQEQQELAKVSSPVRSRLEQNQAALTTRFDNAVIQTGGEEGLPSSSVIDSVLNKADALDKEISSLYRAVRETAPSEKNIRFDSLVKALKAKTSQNRTTGGAIEAIIGDLREKGVITGKDLKVTGAIDVEAAEDVRKLMNELFDPQNGFRNTVLRDLKGKVDDDVFNAAGEDIFRKARKAKADFEKGLSRDKISKFDSSKANLTRDILENKINPDRIVDDVVFSKKWRDTDLKQLKDYIADSAEGVKAFNDLRADSLRRITDKTFSGPIDDQGFRAMNVSALRKELSSLGKKKMDVLFTKEEQRFLSRMVKAGELVQPVRGTGLGKGPSAQAVRDLDSLIRRVPFLGEALDKVKIDRAAGNILKGKPATIPRKVSETIPISVGVGAEVGKQVEELQNGK